MTLARPMFPPRADSADSFSVQPAPQQSEAENLASDSPGQLEGLDLALLRFVRCLVGYGATIEEAATVVAGELEGASVVAEKMRRQARRRSQLALVEA